MVPTLLRPRRNPDRAGRIAVALLLGALTAAFQDAQQVPDVQRSVRYFEDYVRALNRFGSASGAEWRQGVHEMRSLPAHLWEAEKSLVDAAGTSPEARRELHRRGRIYALSNVFSGDFQQVLWQSSWEELRGLGPDAVEHLADKLLRQLLTMQRRDVWEHLRYYLVECGETARAHTELMLADLVQKITAREAQTGALIPMEHVTQCLQVLIAFGDSGRAAVVGAAGHPSPRVRAAVAEAIGDSRDPSYTDSLLRLAADEHWVARASAAEALGKFRYRRAEASRTLMERLPREPNHEVRQRILDSLATLRVEDAVPLLMDELNQAEAEWHRLVREIVEDPSYKPSDLDWKKVVQNKAVNASVRQKVDEAVITKDQIQDTMVALWKITGQRLPTPARWREWFARR